MIVDPTAGDAAKTIVCPLTGGAAKTIVEPTVDGAAKMIVEPTAGGSAKTLMDHMVIFTQVILSGNLILLGGVTWVNFIR